MSRYYLVYVRDYEFRCGGQTRRGWGDDPDGLVWRICTNVPRENPNWHAYPCPHDPVILDTWSLFSGAGNTGASVYDSPGKANAQISRLMSGRRGRLFREMKAEAKVMYFDDEDLMTHTEDRTIRFQELEAKMLRAGQLADEAEQEPLPEVKQKRPRKKVKSE